MRTNISPYILLILALIGAITVIVILVLQKEKKSKNNINNPYGNPINVPGQYIHPQFIQMPQIIQAPQIQEIKLQYRKKYLLTKNEWGFYKALKPIADELGYTVLAKIRVADIVEPIPNKNQSEWHKYFNKISRKHIDFALAKPENLQIMLLIELDDSSHDIEQKKRDEFIEALYKHTGYNFIRVRGSGELKMKIENALKVNEKTPN